MLPGATSTVELCEGEILEQDSRAPELMVVTENSTEGRNQIDHAAD
jgi:hypothetical protein